MLRWRLRADSVLCYTALMVGLSLPAPFITQPALCRAGFFVF
jgi:hypothetical protein